MASYYRPEGRPNLYVKYKLGGRWLSKATEFLPGQEKEALAYALRLERGPSPTADGPMTVYAWAERWLNGRSDQVETWKDDQSRLEHHVLPRIGRMLMNDVRPAHLVPLVDEWKAKGLAPRTIRNIYSVVKAMWRDARIMDITTSDPCILTARQLGKLRDKDLGWRKDAVFNREEMLALMMDERIPFFRRVLYGLLGVAMLRDGEVAGLRWGRVDLDAKPLGRLIVVASYDKDTTKTETERWMPIHQGLSPFLYLWRMQEWAKEFGRPPTDGDLVVPAPKPTNRGPRKAQGSMLDKNWIWKRVTKDTAALGFRHRRVHDLRRTGISHTREDGADKFILGWGTHAPPKTTIDLYTSVEWEKLCLEVSKRNFGPREPLVVGPKRARPLVMGGRRTRRGRPVPSRRA